jgi:hypothetical protein
MRAMTRQAILHPAPGVLLSSYGLRIGLRATDRATLEHLAGRLPPGRSSAWSAQVDRSYSLIRDGSRAGAGEGHHVLSVDGQRLIEGDDLRRIGDAFESDVRLYIAEMAPDRVFIHAGAVGWRGEAILMPGRSLSGKTTLVTAFVRAGATYYSDEYAVLDEQGRVHPYAAALSIRQGNGASPRKCPVETLGGRPGTEPLPVSVVVISEYQSGAVWQPRVLSAGHGALAILANSVSGRRRPVAALAALRHVVVRAVVLEGRRGEAGATVTALLNSL